ncbi:MAG: GTP-binding protein [Magnetococcales bacterium]|nr:GTP-binding protein [Magnetococcales bacterium]
MAEQLPAWAKEQGEKISKVAPDWVLGKLPDDGTERDIAKKRDTEESSTETSTDENALVVAQETLPATPADGAHHLELAEQSLRELLDTSRVPEEVRRTLTKDYDQVKEMLDKVEQGHIHIAVFGRVSVGKSALLNALVGEELFSVSPLHGETVTAHKVLWKEKRAGGGAGLDGVHVIDTPGINEVDGEDRERMAREVVERCDLVIFVVDGDLTESEYQALREVQASHRRPLVLALNKADRYTLKEKETLLEILTERTEGLVEPDHIVSCAAMPRERIYIQLDERGNETEIRRTPPPEMELLKERVWDILEREGRTLAAVNATLFAGQLTDRVSKGITNYHRDAAEQVIRTYCVGKGIAVAMNPVPVADLLVLAADAAMIVTMGKVYGMTINTSEAGGLIKTIISQMALVMGAAWGVQIASSALKGVSMGFSTVITAGTQGAVAYYSTYVVGRAAERYFAQGKSWGDGGPKQVVKDILDSVDRDTILAQARQDILTRIKPA